MIEHGLNQRGKVWLLEKYKNIVCDLGSRSVPLNKSKQRFGGY